MSDKSPPTSPGQGRQQKTSRHSSSSSSSTAPAVKSSNPHIPRTPHTPNPNLDQQQIPRQSSTLAAKSSKPPTPKPNSPPKNSKPNTPNLSAKTSNPHTSQPNSAAKTRKPKKPNNAAKNSNPNVPKPNSAAENGKPNSPNHATQNTNPNTPKSNSATKTSNPNTPNHAAQNTPKPNSAPNSSNPNTPNATTAQNGNPTPPASAPSGPPPLPSKTHTQDLNYMHRPPRIMPNYGRRQWQQSRLLPKTCIGRVLLYDNVMQQQMLDVKVSGLLSAQRKMGKIMDMHRNSFLLTRMQKQRHVADTVLHVNDVMPEHVTPPRINTTIIALSHAGTPRFERIPPSEAAQERDTAVTKHTHTEENTPMADPASEEGAKEKMVENGEEKDGVSLPPSLPTVPQDRYGASTSFGFALQTPQTSDTRAAHTAAAYRQHQGRGERGGGGGGGQNIHTNSHTLPEIHVTSGQPAHAGKMVLHVDSNKQGLTRLFHSYHQPADHGKKGAGKGKGKLAKNGVFDNRTVEDTRYRRLEKLLVRIEPPNEGYLELSPSFHTPRRSMTFTRPNSFRASIFRRRRSGSARSNLSSSSGGRVVLSSL